MKDSAWLDRLAWVERHSPLTQGALARLSYSPNKELLIGFHIDLKMIPVIRDLAKKISLQVVACNSSTVDHQGWEFLRAESGIELLKPEQAFERLRSPSSGPRFICDLGGELLCRALTHPGSTLAGLEGTTSGITRVRGQLGSHEPTFPIIDWNSAPLKSSIHNEKMVGFSIWQTFTEVTRLSLHGKTVGILGFGAVGRGIARTARHLGGIVAVYDPSPPARTVAAFEGFPTPDRNTLLRESEVVVTATGHPNALAVQDLAVLREGAFLLNAGHGADEIDPTIRTHPDRHQVLSHVEEIRLEDGRDSPRHLFLLARGELLNLSAGFGDTINGFDLTSAQFVQAISYLLDCGADLEPGWHALPPDFSDQVLGF